MMLLQVREALTKKVSRERVGAELEGMFNGEHSLDQSASCDLSLQALVTAMLLLSVWTAPGCL